MKQEPLIIDWVRGDALGIDLPAHAAALEQGGAEWLTRAFRAFGTLDDNTRVKRITQCEELVVGGTGAKMLLSVEYGEPAPELPRDLFVKFSRNFRDSLRDDNRHHMRAEVQFAALSRDPAFPIAVPRCLYTDYEAATGTGVLITERIAYGQGAIEPQLHKCMDHLMPDALSHYREIITSLARLAGAHKSGKLGPAAERDFPLDIGRFMVRDRVRYDFETLTERAARLAAFVSDYSRLFPENVAEPRFLAGFVEDAPHYLSREDAIKTFLHADTDYIALCHWNANIDNGWFWRDDAGELHNGLIDWGSVGQIHLAMAIWGCLSGAEPEIWNEHLDELLGLFVDEYRLSGGPCLDPQLLRTHLELYVMMMGLAWLMEAPPRIQSEIPEPAVLEGPHDPLLASNELARVQLKITANMLNVWQRRDLGRYLRDDAAACGLAAV